MSSFDEREKAFESKYQRDQELQFRTMARRNKLLGLWAAELLGITGTDADAYAKEVVASDFDEPGDDDVLRKVFADLQAKNVEMTEHLLRKKMDSLLETAKQQLATEG